MNKLLATLVAGFFAVGAFAQAPAGAPVVATKPAALAAPAKVETKDAKADVKAEAKADVKADAKADVKATAKAKAEKNEVAKAEKKAAKAANMGQASAVKADAKISPLK
mgnify:CR=1 FL=1